MPSSILPPWRVTPHTLKKIPPNGSLGTIKPRWLIPGELIGRHNSQRSNVVRLSQAYRRHTAVREWLAAHPRLELVMLPGYCPKANPIERAFGDVHDKCTRNHRHKRLCDLVKDVLRHFQVNGPWCYRISNEVYYTPEITQAVTTLEKEAILQAA